MNMFPINPDPIEPMLQPDELAVPEGPGVPDPYDAMVLPDPVPIDPVDPLAGGLEDRIEILEAVDALQPQADPAIDQVWEQHVEAPEPVAGPVAQIEQTPAPDYEVPKETTEAQVGTNGEPAERFDLPGGACAVETPGETVIHDPATGMTIREKKPFGDMLILTPAARRELTPATPDRMLSDKVLRAKYGNDLDDWQLDRIRDLDRRGRQDEILTTLGRARGAAGDRIP